METERIADWMYRNKTKVIHEIINQKFDNAYNLLKEMLKSGYTHISRLMRT